MLKIKLFPKGKKHQRTFRIVVAEARSKFNGKIVADLGFVTPQSKTLQLDKDLFSQWVKNGAQVTVGVDRLLNPNQHPKKIKPKKVTEPKAEKKVAPEVKVEEVKPVEEIKN
jgi:ribosomal protein S16